MSNLEVKKEEQLVKRWIIYTIGMFLMGTGIALMIKANIGVSPISAVTTNMNEIWGVSLGVASFILNFIMFIGEFVLDPKSFKLSKFVQLIPTLLTSIFIDLNMLLVGWVNPTTYIPQLAILVLGCAVLGFSLSLMIGANVVLMPNEAFISVVADKTHKEWGNIRTLLDVVLVIVAAILGLVAFGAIHNIREGTLISAIIVGQFSRIFTKMFVYKFFEKKDAVTVKAQ